MKLCNELSAIRGWLPGRVWFRFDPDSQSQGEAEALACIDLVLAELLATVDPGLPKLAGWLFFQVRNRLRPAKTLALDELQEEALAPDESREIEAPEGSSEELEQLWDGTLDPFEWLTKHRGGQIKETDYQILIRMAQDMTLEQIGRELQMSGDAVRKRVARFHASLFR